MCLFTLHQAFLHKILSFLSSMEFTTRQQWIDATVENNRLVAQTREDSCAGLLWEAWWISKLKYLFELNQSHLLRRWCFGIRLTFLYKGRQLMVTLENNFVIILASVVIVNLAESVSHLLNSKLVFKGNCCCQWHFEGSNLLTRLYTTTE